MGRIVSRSTESACCTEDEGGPFGVVLRTIEANIRRQHRVASDHDFVFCLQTRDGRNNRRVRHEPEVNMRESERERLARWDAYERGLERRAKTRKQG
jgi:hypothetical protein